MKTIYDVLGPDGYQQLYGQHLASAEADVRDWHKELDRLGLPSSGRLLDVGCGLGERTNVWAHRGYTVTGIDRCQSLLVAARSRFPELKLLESDACQSFEQERFDVGVAHFNFLMMLPLEEVHALLRALRVCISPNGAFLTDVSLPREDPLNFRECWSFNGKAFTEVGTLLEDGYQHEWFEAGERVCQERFWFRTRDTYQEIARSCGWNVRILDWKSDVTRMQDLMIFL